MKTLSMSFLLSFIFFGAGAFADGPASSHLVCEPVEDTCTMVTSHLTASLKIEGTSVTTQLNRIWMCNQLLSPIASGVVTSSQVDPQTQEIKIHVEFAEAVQTASDPGYMAKSEDLTIGPDLSSATLSVLSDSGRHLGQVGLRCSTP